jgi:hypothetical protein
MVGFASSGFARPFNSNSPSGGPLNWQDLADKKYASIAEQNRIAGINAGAGMMDAKSNAAQVDSQNAYRAAQAGFLGVQTEQMPLDGASERALRAAQGRNADAQTMGENQLNANLDKDLIRLILERAGAGGSGSGGGMVGGSGLQLPSQYGSLLNSTSRFGFNMGMP